MYLCAVNNILADIMPRQERLHSATGIYHFMLRGINKQDIFEDDGDYLQTELHSQVNERLWCGNTPALSIDRCLLWSYTEVMKKEKMITEPSPGHKFVQNEQYSAKSADFLRFLLYLCHVIDDFACLDLQHQGK